MDSLEYRGIGLDQTISVFFSPFAYSTKLKCNWWRKKSGRTKVWKKGRRKKERSIACGIAPATSSIVRSSDSACSSASSITIIYAVTFLPGIFFEGVVLLSANTTVSEDSVAGLEKGKILYQISVVL